jgi:hypothetical protein
MQSVQGWGFIVSTSDSCDRSDDGGDFCGGNGGDGPVRLEQQPGLMLVKLMQKRAQ